MKLKISFLIFFVINIIQAQELPNAMVFTGGKKFERDQFIDMFESLKDITFTEYFNADGTTDFKNPDISTYDVLVFYNVSQHISEIQKEAFLNLLEQGKPMLFLHHALVCYQDWPTYEHIVGGKYYHAKKGKDSLSVIPSTYKHDEQIPVQIINRNHPITYNMNDFVILDEVYNKFKRHNNVTPILSTTHPESEKVIAWTHTYGNAPIVFIQLGHDHQAYENTNYRTLINNAIQWLAKTP
ncbi:ThuA domain-containing protein [Formosa sp. A9]|uniref:ThuA domain-containing protein n=1 Tax=Formosa sp. A9 TaxID=3442641 RepID=UPI003EC1019C